MFRKLRISLITLLILATPFYFAYPYLEFARLWFGVVGVDVSHYQGDIDWNKVSTDGISFAYIKATEGGDYVDPTFKDNSKRAKDAGLAVGAYHFFTRCKSGHEQAQNFLALVPPDSNTLPPAIDAEKLEPCPNSSVVLDPVTEIGAMMDDIEKTFGCRPIIYTTPAFELSYLHGNFLTEAFWVRSILVPPFIRSQSWQFWQYHDAGIRSGIAQPVDLNVFRGSKSDFAAFRLDRTCGKRVSH